MAIALSLASTNKRRNHRLITATIGAVTTWQTLTFPADSDFPTARVEVINHGADSIYLSTEVEDGDAGTGGVEVPTGQSYSFPCGGVDEPYIAVRHESGSYTFGVQLLHQEAV